MARSIHTGGPAGPITSGTASRAAGHHGVVPGMVTVKVAAHVGMGANASMLTPGINTLVKVPLSVGKAGTFTGYFKVLGSTHYITVDFYAWTPHTQTFTGLTTRSRRCRRVVAMG